MDGASSTVPYSLNATSPIFVERGTIRENARAAAFAASSRDGCTSVAIMLLLASTAMTTAARLTGIGTAATGRAMATASSSTANR